MDLSDFFTTKAQATDFSARLETFSEMMYKTDFQVENALTELFGMQKKEKFLTLLRENNIAIDSPSSLKDFTTKVKMKIAQLPVFSFTIAFEPKEITLKAIADWFAVNLKKQMIFDFTVDTSLIAGATINYNGKFKDYSLKQPIQTLLMSLLQAEKPTLQPNIPIPQQPALGVTQQLGSTQAIVTENNRQGAQ